MVSVGIVAYGKETVMDMKHVVREIMAQQGVTLDAMAERTGVHRTTVWHSIGDRTSSMGSDKAVAMLAAMGYEVAVVPAGSRLPRGSYRVGRVGEDG